MHDERYERCFLAMFTYIFHSLPFKKSQPHVPPSQKVIEATDGQPVPSFADDIVAKGDMLIPKDQTVSTADDSQGKSQSNINEENGDAGGEAGGGGGGAIVASDEDVWYESEEPSCSICLCAYEPGDDICWSCNTRCTHAFHVECMSEWLQNHNDCPQCRREYLKSDAECSAEEEEDGDDGDEGEMDDVDLERGQFGGASLRPSAADLELPQWYRETIPGIGLRISSTR
mmetsp:Transcript_17808/g.35849  ORF Transcript_17808/g.35849 Transcript_17808/m.35849 type:complete len:229 (+) Transcript_17808:744-1430(+)